MRTLYAERQASLLRAVNCYLDWVAHGRGEERRYALMGWLPPGVNAVQAFLARTGFENICAAAHLFVPRTIPAEGLLLGYAGVQEKSMTKSVQGLAQALESLHS